MQLLQTPPVFHELYGQPVEQFRVARLFRPQAEIECPFDKRLIEVPQPDMIDEDSCSERVFPVRNPVRKGEPPAGTRFGILRAKIFLIEISTESSYEAC